MYVPTYIYIYIHIYTYNYIYIHINKGKFRGPVPSLSFATTSSPLVKKKGQWRGCCGSPKPQTACAVWAKSIPYQSEICNNWKTCLIGSPAQSQLQLRQTAIEYVGLR